MKNKLIVWIAGFGLVSGIAGCSSIPTVFTDIDVPGAVSTHPRGINNASSAGSASIVGYYVDKAGNINGFQRDLQTSFVTLVVDGAIEVKAFDINNSGPGEIVGTVRDAFGQRAFLLDGGVISFPGNPPIPTAYGINDGGLIVGTFSDMAGRNYGFTFPPGPSGPISVFNDLSTQTFGINNTRRMVGTLQEATGEFNAFYLSGPDIASAERIVIPGATRSDAYGINDADAPDEVRHVGTYTKDGIDRGFIFTEARGVETFNVPRAKHTRAFGINDAGEIVGEYVDSFDHTHGFLGTFR
ncbi:hypothetical protein [Nitrosospira briensis]|uniref:hypothetical protein n=1 Tax=Nitrosospira briensis TaxID=35799 RepID=UPI00046A82FE|nr:hypothetical protein [Nitrosospira briensis]